MANNKNYSKKGSAKRSSSSNSAKKPNNSKKQTSAKGKNQSASKNKSSAKRTVVNAEIAKKPAVQNDFLIVLSFVASLFFFFFTVVEGENVWFDIHSFVLGVFGNFSIIWAIFFIYASARAAYNRTEGAKNGKVIAYIIAGLLLLSTFWYIFFSSSIYHDGVTKPSYFEVLSASYNDGSHGNGACIISSLFGGLLCVAFGVTGAKISILLLILLFMIIICGYKIDFIYKGWKSVEKYLKGEWNELVSLFKNRKEKKEPIRQKKVTGEVENTLLKERRNYSFEQFERITEDEYSQNTDTLKEKAKEKPQFNFDIPIDEDDVDITEIMSGEVLYNADQSKQSIMDFLGIDALDDEKEFFDEDEEDNFDLDEIFDRRDNLRKENEEQEDKQTENNEGKYFTETDKSENNADNINDDPFNVMGAEAGEIIEENVDYYKYPPISLLSKPADDDGLGVTPELRANGELLVQTLKSFGVSTRIVNISRGPAITRYELQPSAGVKISRITSLADDIALNLSASAVRIEAPIPGKPAVGIEIPNKKVSVVKAREIIDTNEFNVAKSKLTVALGKDINGDSALADLAKMPHLLIAGATGSGKSVCINSIIISLLYKASPDEVKLLMIDPKVVELGVYNGIPHLLVPVVTDPKKAAGALAWAVTEMLKRYNTFADNNVRDIFGYNEYAEQNNMRKMEQIVIIIDELADLMMVAAKEVEDSICRLAQMARAAGMYLIIATQRPSVDIITGVIKANIPSRIAFAVSSQVDSRTILDSSGAEKLIGRGDMLFVPMGATKPKRIQGCFISDKEIEHIAEFVKNSHTVEYDEEVSSEIDRQAELAVKSKKGKNSEDDGGGFDFEDEALMQAIEFVIDAGQASTSMLQRRLRVGYARAGRLIDEMENMGIVGPHEGSKPRSVLMTKAQFLEMKMRKGDSQSDTEE